MVSLAERLIKNSSSDNTSLIAESVIYNEKDMIQTSVPALNIALGGAVNKGLTPGLTVIAGESKRFKSLFSLIMGAAFQKKYPDGVLLFYDSEFGTPKSYFSALGIDMDRVVYTPVTDVEQLKFDATKQLDGLTREDHVMFILDSLGNLASKKEVDDALEGKSVADMSRAKQIKSFFRIVTPHLTIKDIPFVVVNHTYKEQGLFPKDIVSGGTGPYLSADTIWIIGRRQETSGTGAKKTIDGYQFIINVEKSRYVKEKSKIPITVTYEGGIQKWSGILDLAIEAGVLETVGRSVVFGNEKHTIDSIENDDNFWVKVFAESSLNQYITDKYTLSNTRSIVPKFVGEEEEA